MNKKRNDLIGGILLIGLGALALIGQFVDFTETMGLLVLPIIAAAFLAAGVLTRHAGFIIPGGILGGLGLGAYLVAGPAINVNGDAEGGVFFLGFAAGWALITLLTAVFTKETHWWPLIPGGIMALLGGSLLFGGMFQNTLEIVGKLWPAALILGGFYIIFKGYQHNQEKVQ